MIRAIHYGKDNFGGKGVGNGYSANYWALFQMIRSYVTTTRDFEFLDQVINGIDRPGTHGDIMP